MAVADTSPLLTAAVLQTDKLTLRITSSVYLYVKAIGPVAASYGHSSSEKVIVLGTACNTSPGFPL